ncbi:MAG: DUF3298 domain-containing protein [Chloroflexi bacterium]|nr:DUF3298 domain-containing protein [Chloroflexota bacterium]MBI3167637.1 DUF3298 domain-containing protein [Chloroflexota bacterium]
MKNNFLFLSTILFVTMLACSLTGTPAPNVSVPPASTEAQAVVPTFTPIPSFTPEAPTAAAALSSGLTMQSSPVEEAGAEPPYTIKAQVPYLQGSDDVRVQNFNTYLKQIVQNEIDGFKINTLAFATTPPLVNGSSLEIQYSVLGQRGDIWSIQFLVYFYADGAAHPGHYSISVNYDLANGRELNLDELFLPGVDYLTVIADLCKAELATRDIGFESFSGGADPLPENYQRWNLSNEGFLVITFDEYQVAPYAVGPQTVMIPFSALQSIIDPNGVIALFAQ